MSEDFLQSHNKDSVCQGQKSKYFYIAQHTLRFTHFEDENFYDIDCHLAINKNRTILLTHSTEEFYFFSLISISRQIKLINKLCFYWEPFPKLSISATNQIRFLKFMKKSVNEQFIVAHGQGKICIWSQDEIYKWNVKIICEVYNIRQVCLSPCENIILIKGLKSFHSFILTRSLNDEWEFYPDFVYLMKKNSQKEDASQTFCIDAFLLQKDQLQLEFITNQIFLCINSFDLKLYKWNFESKKIEEIKQNLISQENILLQFNQQRKMFSMKMNKSVLFLRYEQSNQFYFEENQILFGEDLDFSVSDNGEIVVKVFGTEQNNQLKLGKLRI